MGLFDTLSDITGGTNAVQGVADAINSIFGEDGIFGHSSWYKTLKNGEAQNQVNQQMAQWNMENVTKPVFEMENKEFDRRFEQQNAEWERQFNLQNEYNTPAAQLQRMREAGQNPAGSPAVTMAAANGNVGNPTVNEAASAFAQPANLFDARIAEAQVKQMEANAARAIAQNRLTERDIREKEINMKTLAELNQGRVELQNCQIETEKSNQKLTRQKIKESKALIGQINAYSATLEKQLPIMDQQLKNMKEQFFEISANIRRTNAQTENIDQETLNAQQDHFYKTIVNKYVEEQQKWLINEAKSRYNLNNTEAYEALQEAKKIIQEGQITDWKFKNTRYAWNKIGKWEVDFQGGLANWRYKNVNMFNDLENAKMQFEQMRTSAQAQFWYVQQIVNHIREKGGNAIGNLMMGGGAAGKANKLLGTESYQFFE